MLCDIKIVLTFTDLCKLTFCPQDNNVYNFIAPEVSALEAIKRSHHEHHVYSMSIEDVNFNNYLVSLIF